LDLELTHRRFIHCFYRIPYSIQLHGRQVFCSCRSEAVEQPSSWSATCWH